MKTQTKLKKLALAVAVLVVLGGAGALLASANVPPAGVQAKAPLVDASEEAGASAADEPESVGVSSQAGEEEEVSLAVFSSYEELATEELVERSTLVVRGKVEEARYPVLIEDAYGNVCAFTDYEVSVEETFRGEAKEKILVRQVGGGDEASPDAPSLEVGKEYLLYLTKPSMGGSFHTEGDYYNITHGLDGICEMTDPPTAAWKTPRGSGRVDLAGFAQKVEAVNKASPVNENREREEFLRNVERNLQSGFLTREEADQMIAEAEQYAKIIEPKE